MGVYVTGATGFIGSHFLRGALEAGHEVVALRNPGSRPKIPIPDSDRLTWIEGDLNALFSPSTPSFSATRFSPPATSSSALVHFAAYGVSPQACTWEKAFTVNVLESILLMERAIEVGISSILVCGSCVEYGKSAERYENIPSNAPLEPVGHYAASKAAQSIAASALCREKNVPLTILRLFSVYGEGQHPDNIWPSLHKAAMAGEDFPMSGGEQIRDFVPVKDVAEAFLEKVLAPELQVISSAFEEASHDPLCATPPLIRITNVGTGCPQTVRAFAEHWWDKWEAKGKLLPGALPYRPNEVMRYVPEVSPLFTPPAATDSQQLPGFQS